MADITKPLEDEELEREAQARADMFIGEIDVTADSRVRVVKNARLFVLEARKKGYL